VSRLQDLTIDVEGGTIAARVFRPEAPTGAALVYFHGGGWVLGSVDGHAYPCSCLAARSGATVISVEYRLAPEHPYPVPVDDCYRAWQAVRQRAEELGIDPGRIAVGGDSAGGNLAAAVCLRAIARGEPRPAFQLLVYPATDLVEDAASVELFAEGFLLGRRGMIWFKDHYAPVERRREPECSPLLAPSLEAHPPAYVLLAGFDPLRDEGRAYAKRLEEAGVEVVLDEVPSSMHGFFNLGWYIPVADAAMHRAAEALREALG
jgi:acetyl esterase